ncbi:hypothetical protein HQ590_14610 [bacterium]|nr:hypothetical protein [bacterium]
MTTNQATDREDLVEVHQARDEWEGNLLVGYLRDNGIDATYRAAPSLPPLDAVERLSGRRQVGGLFVLEHDADGARNLIAEFLAAVTDEDLLEEAAAQKLRLDRDTISRLRRELREERRTYDYLGWLAVVFLGAGAALWAIWPAWLKVWMPGPGMRWILVLLLAVTAVLTGNLVGRRMK